MTDVTAHAGTWSYRLPTQPPSGWNGVDDIAIHTAKFAAHNPKLERMQYPSSRSGGVVRYSAYFYIESGFDDVVDPARPVNPWHIQMQWKGSKPFYVPENPKLAWGFHTVRESGDETLQVTLTIREATPDSCHWSFDFFTRSSSLHLPALAVPRHEWVKVTTEVRFHERLGYVRIWQGEAQALVVDVSGINTLTQLVTPSSPYVAYLPADEPSCQDLSDPNNVRTYFRTKTQSFEWGITNYLSTRSYMSTYRTATDNHVVLADDILVEIH